MYRKLRNDLCVLDASDTLSFQQVAESLPGPSTTLPAEIIEYLQGLDPREARQVVGVGHLLMGRYQASKSGAKPPAVEEISQRYKISAREIHEVKRGQAYLGGKQKLKQEVKQEAESTPSKKRKIKSETTTATVSTPPDP